jgi:FAD/FMN-containing dehydrogenase
MLTRRRFLDLGMGSLLAASVIRPVRTTPRSWLNDVHSGLNLTPVRGVHSPNTLGQLLSVVRDAGRAGQALSIAGARHAMGGQQFLTDGWVVDMADMNRVLAFDARAGLVECEAGIQWPELMDHLERAQAGHWPQWGIAQKQTGADRLSLGGALAANVHGRGLAMKPFIDDVESFVLIDATGELRRCSRTDNADLFRLAIGGYGLFGVIASVTLKLSRRRKLERVVEIIGADELMPAFERRIVEGFLYGDFQFSTDERSDTFLRRGVFSCYRPVADDVPIRDAQQELGRQDWAELLYYGHTDRRRAYELYTRYYLSTSGQIYWSDGHQRSTYLDGYHRELDRRMGTGHAASEMITEIYVPRAGLASFLDRIRDDFRRHRVELIYGTIRLIARDDESFLAWARQPWACIIFNLHVAHTEDGVRKAAADFRRLIDRAIECGGSYYLTYHRFAERKQVEACYPQFAEFLRLKCQHDPDERFQSDWYRHYRAMFADVL